MTCSVQQENSLAKLQQLLGEELECLGKFQAVLLKKQQALVAHDLGKIDPFVEQEHKYVSALVALEAQRIAATAVVAVEHSLCAEDLTLDTLLEVLKLRQSSHPLAKLADKLEYELEVLVELNYNNELLMQNLLEYTEMVISTVAMEHDVPRYGCDGKFAEGQQSRPIIDDVV